MCFLPPADMISSQVSNPTLKNPIFYPRTSPKIGHTYIYIYIYILCVYIFMCVYTIKPRPFPNDLKQSVPDTKICAIQDISHSSM